MIRFLAIYLSVVLGFGGLASLALGDYHFYGTFFIWIVVSTFNFVFNNTGRDIEPGMQLAIFSAAAVVGLGVTAAFLSSPILVPGLIAIGNYALLLYTYNRSYSSTG